MTRPRTDIRTSPQSVSKHEREYQTKIRPHSSQHPDYYKTVGILSSIADRRDYRGEGFVTLSCSPAELAGRQTQLASELAKQDSITCENTKGCLRFLATIRREFEMKGLYHP